MGQGHIAQDTENKIQIRKMVMAPVIWQGSEINHQNVAGEHHTLKFNDLAPL